MSTSFFLAVGGTGNKVLESMVYACATGSLYEQNKNGARTPLRELTALIVDVDAACGNTTRAKQAAEHYEAIRKGMLTTEMERQSFVTKLNVSQWTMNLEMRNASIETLTRNAERDRLLARTLFTQTESDLVYNEGFRGHPDLGVLFFAGLLKAYQNINTAPQDEMSAFLIQVQNALDGGGGVHVMLAGSIFGGTGASGIPMISRFLHQRFADSATFTLSAILMLPYFNVPPSVTDETSEIVVKSSTFLDKARTALHYYGMENMIRKDMNDPDGVYDALYLLGLPQEAFVTASNYSTGSHSQQNEAHLLEWMTVSFAAHFYANDFHRPNQPLINCYYYQWQTWEAGWDCFAPFSHDFRTRYGGMLKAAALFMVECYPTLRLCVRNERAPETRMVNYWTAFFYNTKQFSDPQRDEMGKLIQELYHFMSFYINWVWQILHSMPPALCSGNQEQTNRSMLKRVYGQLLDVREAVARGGEAAQSPDNQNELKRLKRELQRLVDTQEETVYLELLYQEQATQSARVKKQMEAMDTLGQKINRWKNENAHLTTASALQAEQTKLQLMAQKLDDLKLRDQLVREDTRAAAQGNHSVSKADKAEESPLKNGFFNYDLVSKLHDLLEQYGNNPEDRNLRDTAALRDTLWKEFSHLITQSMVDRVGAAKAVAGMGGVSWKAETPERAFEGFTLALIAAVTEGGKA